LDPSRTRPQNAKLSTLKHITGPTDGKGSGSAPRKVIKQFKHQKMTKSLFGNKKLGLKTEILWLLAKISIEIYLGVTNTSHNITTMYYNGCKGNPNSLDEQLCSQDLVRGNPK
jgi:hypothetical protein